MRIAHPRSFLLILALVILASGAAHAQDNLMPYSWLPDTGTYEVETIDSTLLKRNLTYFSTSGGVLASFDGREFYPAVMPLEANFAWQSGFGITALVGIYSLHMVEPAQVLIPLKIGPSATFVTSWHAAFTPKLQAGVSLEVVPSFAQVVTPTLEMGLGLTSRFFVNHPWNLYLSIDLVYVGVWAWSARLGLAFCR